MALYGAYQVFMSALAAQAVFIVAAAVWFVRKKVGRSGNPAALKDVAENARPDLEEIFADHIPNYRSRRILH